MLGPLLTLEEVSAILRVPASTLYQWRWKGEGPPAVKVGRHLRYSPDALERWLDSRSDTPRPAA